MDIKILDSSFNMLYVVDEYESFIWTERYNEVGEFELVTNASTANYTIFELGNYLEIDDSSYTMIIESVTTSSESESGIKMTVSGHSLESILNRRIFLSEFSIDSSVSDPALLWSTIKKLLNKTVMGTPEGTSANRVISGFTFTTPDDDDPVKTITVEDSVKIGLGDGLLDAIESFCQEAHVGFKLQRKVSNNNLVFSLFCGTDRSYEQTTNDFVIFSPEFDNVVNSNYLHSIENYKNVALITGQSKEDSNDKVKVTLNDDKTGLDRREVYLSFDNLTAGTGTTTDKYKTQLKARGKAELAKADYCENKSFEGEVDNKNTFIYGKDYFVGDIVEMVNEFGATGRVRVTELVRSDDAEGIRCYPTLISTEEED